MKVTRETYLVICFYEISKHSMKICTLALVLILTRGGLSGQSAEELWTALQTRYEGLANYIDEGEYVQVNDAEGRYYTSIYRYNIAIDSNKHAWHAFKRIGTGASGRNVSTSYTYEKSGGDTSGLMIRNFEKPDTVVRTLSEACASLLGVGGGVLHDVAGLMFPGLYQEFGDASGNFHFDTLIRAQDTMIGVHECYVIELVSSYWNSEQMIQKRDQRRDSILNARGISMNMQLYFVPQDPHWVTRRARYSVRKTDGLVCYRETEIWRDDKRSSHSSLYMDPQSNVQMFEEYIRGFQKSN